MDPTLLAKVRDYAMTGGGSGMIVRHGRVVMQWGDQRQTFDLKSSTKAIGVTAVGLAFMDGKFQSLHEPASKHHPTFGASPEGKPGDDRLERITLFHLAAQSGFAKVAGGPQDFVGVNIRTETGERQGDDRRGLKASGMLFVDGVLYSNSR